MGEEARAIGGKANNRATFQGASRMIVMCLYQKWLGRWQAVAVLAFAFACLSFVKASRTDEVSSAKCSSV